MTPESRDTTSSGNLFQIRGPGHREGLAAARGQFIIIVRVKYISEFSKRFSVTVTMKRKQVQTTLNKCFQLSGDTDTKR